MIIPNKFDDLDSNPMVIGSFVLQRLKDGGCNLEDLFRETKKTYEVTLDRFLDTVTFLWICKLIDVHRYHIKLAEGES